VDEEEFTQYLIAQGYSEAEARALAGDEDLAPDGFLEITGRDGRPVQVGVDASMGFAGVVRFTVPGQPGREEREDEVRRRNTQLVLDLAAAQARITAAEAERDEARRELARYQGGDQSDG
jgi:hypothetical protein